MFFNSELLTKKKGTGAFGVIWLAATLGPRSHYKKLTKKEVTSVDIPGACTYLQAPPEPMALRLTSSLVVGLTRVFAQQYAFYYTDVQGAYHRLKRSLLSINEEEINMQVIEAKHDAITLELEDELRLDAVFRPPLPGSAKKIKAGEIMHLDYQFLMDPENSLSQDSSIASRKRNTLPGIDILSSVKSSFQALPSAYDASTHHDAASIIPGSAKLSLLREPSEGLKDDFLMQDDPLMNLNDGGFDLFGGDLAGLDFAAMVDAEHAEAREANNKRRKRDRGELEGEEEKQDKENDRFSLNAQPFDDQMQMDTAGFFDTQARQDFNADMLGSLPINEEPTVQDKAGQRKKKRRSAVAVKADEKIEMTNNELLGHIKQNGSDIARFLIDEASLQAIQKERKEQQTAELKQILAAPPFPMAPELRILWDDFIVGEQKAKEYENILMAPQAKRKRAKKEGIEQEAKRKKAEAAPEEHPIEENHVPMMFDDYVPEVEAGRAEDRPSSRATPLRQGLPWQLSDSAKPSSHERSSFLPGNDIVGFDAWSARGSTRDSAFAGEFGTDGGSLFLDGKLDDGGAPAELFDEEQIRAAQMSTIEKEQQALLGYVKDIAKFSKTNSVYFNDVVPLSYATKASAANAFFYVLAMATRDLLKIEQTKPYGEIRIEIRA